MAIRQDISVTWTTSPRIVTVAAPSAALTVQDLYDTLASIQRQPFNMIYKNIVNASGKDALSGGTQVAITLSLQDALLAFAARGGPTYVQCTVSGGNLVAVDASGVAVASSISPTAFTQVVIAQSSSGTLVSGTGVGTATEVANAVWDSVDRTEVNVTPIQAMRLMLAALAGKISGAPAGPVLIRNAVADTKTRINATIDASGNRTAITTDTT